MTILRLPLATRFWPKVQKTSTCWHWTGRVRPDGYGTIRDYEKRHTPAHRAAWMLTYGPIPEGMCVCHRCDVRDCVNPAHLFLGTIRDNKDDEMRKGRHGFGEQHGMARITETDVKAIRAARAKGMSYREIAEPYGLTLQAIRAITIRKTWKHVA